MSTEVRMQLKRPDDSDPPKQKLILIPRRSIRIDPGWPYGCLRRGCASGMSNEARGQTGLALRPDMRSHSPARPSIVKGESGIDSATTVLFRWSMPWPY
ncbi:MAG: hypothetical protein WB778_03195 [Thermoplasmata archaeon]